jgi:hydrogenase expression/formation protein HypC
MTAGWPRGSSRSRRRKEVFNVCLAVPGLVVEVSADAPPFAVGLVEFAGVRRDVCLACVPEVRPGDYVLVHAGVAIARIDEAEAARVLAALEEIGLVEEE